MRLKFALATLLLAAGCGEPSSSEVGDPTDFVELGNDTKADTNEALRVRAAGMTIWADARVLSVDGDWVLSARSSYDIARVNASVGEVDVEAQQTSARKFEVKLEAREMATNLAETPLLVNILTTSGVERTAAFLTRARFGDSSGSSKIYPWKNLDPIVVDGETMFRGRLTTRGEFATLDGYNDDDSEPIMRREDATHWIADFPAYALPWAASPTEDPVVFVARDDAQNRYSRDVHIHVEVAGVGITSLDPDDAWPAATCTEEVRACGDAKGWDADLESCGSAGEVRPCLDDRPVDDTDEYVQKFAQGLRRAIIEHYARHEADILAAGGNPRTEALRIVDSADIEEVTDQDEVPSGRSLAEYRVFRHPDVVFPGSDIVWFGEFDRANGELTDVYEFN